MIRYLPGQIHVEIIKSVIMAAEFFNLICFSCKGFHSPDSGEVFLCHLIQFGCFLTDGFVHRIQFLFQMHRTETDHRKDPQRNQRQQRTDLHHTGEHHDRVDSRLHRQDPDKPCHCPDFVDIILQSRHQFTCIVTVKIIHRQGLYMAEQIPSHVPAYRHADAVISIFFCVLKNSSAHTDSHQPQQKLHQNLYPAIQNDIINDMLCDLRRHHVQHNADQHTDKSEQIPFPVPLQIMRQGLHVSFSPFSFPFRVILCFPRVLCRHRCHRSPRLFFLS